MSTQFTNRQWRLPNNENKDKQSNYSMDFDGTSGVYIIAGDNNSLSGPFTGYTISAWVKTPTSFNTNYNAVFTKKYSFYFGFHQDNSFINYGSSGTAFGTEYKSTYTFSLDTWYYLTATADGTNIKMYVNGVLNDTFADTNTAQISNTSNTPYIGGFDNSGDYDTYKGQIDALAIFDYALTDGTGGTVNQIAALYGSSSTGIGNPMSLSPKPVAYYPLGDQDAFNGSNYLVPNIAAEEDDGDIAVSYSPYALDFDGVNDYIEVPNSTDFDFGTGDFTISSWVNTTGTPTQHRTVVSKQNPETSGQWSFQVLIDGRVSFRANSGGINVLSTTTINDGNWHNIVIQRTGNIFNLYIDKVLADQLTASGQNITNTQVLRIGRRLATYNGYFDGSISNLSIWNAGLTSTQVSEIYNEGVPSNLNNHSAYSNLVSWWQLGSNSSFNTNWTVLDEKGSNNGTSVNMAEDAIVDGVGSYANGLSSGMGGDEVIGDAPYSSSNALSVNMDVEDRVTDTPS